MVTPKYPIVASHFTDVKHVFINFTYMKIIANPNPNPTGNPNNIY